MTQWIEVDPADVYVGLLVELEQRSGADTPSLKQGGRYRVWSVTDTHITLDYMGAEPLRTRSTPMGIDYCRKAYRLMSKMNELKIHVNDDAELELDFDFERRCLTIGGERLVFTEGWTIPRSELWRPLGYKSGDVFARAFRQWRDSGELEEGIHFAIGETKGDKLSPPVMITEIGLYAICRLSKTAVGKKLGRFMDEVVMPAIQRGRSIGPPRAAEHDVALTVLADNQRAIMRLLEGQEARLRSFEYELGELRRWGPYRGAMQLPLPITR